MIRMDINHDGYVSIEDYELMAKKLVEHTSGISKEKTDQILSTLTDVPRRLLNLKPGMKIDLEEAAKSASTALLSGGERQKQIADDLHSMMFDCIDTNNDGHISMEEFVVYFKVIGNKLTPEEVKHSFDTIDSNGDGEISREEFVAAAIEFFLGVEETEVSKVFYGNLLPC